MTVSSQLEGTPCGQRGSYLFYKSFRLWKNGRTKSISVGDCFFVQTSLSSSPIASTEDGVIAAGNVNESTLCIGELQLLWEDKNIDRTLTSCRLYFLPEQTPCGRQENHGEDELIAMSEMLVLHVDDLVQWITAGDVRWERGTKGIYFPPPSEVKEETPSTQLENRTLQVVNDVSTAKLEEIKTDDSRFLQDTEEVYVKILSYQEYCRYRATLKRLEDTNPAFFTNALVIALGGFTVPTPNWRLLFCRATFDNPLLETNELHCSHLVPVLKTAQKKKRLRSKRSNSPSSESNESEESRETQIKEEDSKNGLKSVLAGEDLEEQEFLQRLFKFMRERNTPIERVPHLGFKQINLYVFYTYAKKLGGYDKITLKKLWKHIYDELGGNPGSTSAATCTRRHYERLLLPFERHASGRSSLSDETRKNSNTSSSSPTTSPILPSTPTDNNEPLSPNDSAAIEFTQNENLVSSSPGNKDHNIDSQQQYTSDSLQSSSNCFIPIPLSQSTKQHHDQSETNVASGVEASSSKTSSSSNLAEREAPENHFEDLKQCIHASFQTNGHLSVPVEVSAQLKQTAASLQKKRAKSEYIAEIGRKWDEIRRRHAIEKEKSRHLSASYKANSLRSIRFNNKDSHTKTFYTESPHQKSSKLSYPANHSNNVCSPSLAVTSGMSSVPSKSSFCSLMEIDNTKLISNATSNQIYEGYCDMKRMKASTMDERRSETVVSLNSNGVTNVDVMRSSSVGVSDSGDVPLHKSKEHVDKCLRPSVIQHTHTAANNQVHNSNLCKDKVYENDGKLTHRVNHDLGRRSIDSLQQSIPAAHQNFTSGNHYSLSKANLNCEQLLRPQDANFTMPFNQIKNVPNAAHSLSSTNTSKNFTPPMTFPPVRKSSPSPWTSSSPNGRPPSINAAEKRSEPESVVLDLSCNKKLKPYYSNDNYQLSNPGVNFGEEKELDLSLKNKRQVNEVKQEQEVKPRVKMVHPFVRSLQPGISSVSNVEGANHHHHQQQQQEDSKQPCKPIPVSTKQAPSPRNTSTSSVNAAVTPHNICYMSAENKFPPYYSIDYNAQMPNLLSAAHPPPPHLYGLPFPVTTAHPHLLPEQLQANLASVYKELYQKGIYHPVPYPTYDFSAHIYPSIYKEHSSPYLYYPK